jgi:hypothetical protein
MFFRCHCTEPKLSWNLALLAHIYAKVAICKSCEGGRRRHSRKRLSPGNPRFGAITPRSSGEGMVAVPVASPAEISSSVGVGSLGLPSQGSLLNTPQDGAFRPLRATSPLPSLAQSRPQCNTKRPDTHRPPSPQVQGALVVTWQQSASSS